MTKDYYKILGVTEFNTADEIKNAYRKLARKWHPDIAGNTEDVIVMFKNINEAYDTLSNPIKKNEYDRARRFYNYAKESSERKEKSSYKKTETAKKGFSFNWEDFILRKKRNESFKEEHLPQKGADITTDVEISVLEAIEGVTKVVNMLQTQMCPKCKGRKFVNGTLCQHCNGKGEETTYKKFSVKIPAGISDGAKIRLQGEGNKGLYGGKNGDLYIIIHLKDNQNYKTEGLNIPKTVPISPYEAVLGANIKINTISGSVIVKINPNTQNGQKIRLSGCGIVQNNKVGDMIITVEIRIPQNISQAEIELYKQLESISVCSVRDRLYD